MDSNTLTNIVLFGPLLVMSVVLHEIAHGYVAWKLGDPTAKQLGRLTLNPIKHIDPVMTIIVPGIFILSGSPIVFGGAKPVPVAPIHFKNPRRGMMWVAIAGPITNFILASIFYAIYYALTASGIVYFLPQFILSMVAYGLIMNLVLGAFNFIPVPPLDGGRIAVGLLPRSLALLVARLEPFGLLIVVFLLFSGVIDVYLKKVLDLILFP